MDKSLFFTLAVSMLLLSSCGIAANIRARNDVENSKAEYKDCLKQHPDDLSKCDALKKAYEADLEYWSARTRIGQPSGTLTIEDKSKN
jgi:outer membrane biogenesis lipoprotein LolB